MLLHFFKTFIVLRFLSFFVFPCFVYDLSTNMMAPNQLLENFMFRVNARHGGSLLVSQWCFLVGTPCSITYDE